MSARNDLPRCPSCFRNENVRPLSISINSAGWPTTSEYECSSCAKVFKPAPPESGYPIRKAVS